MTKKNKIPFATMQGIVQRGTVATLCMISSLLFVAGNCEKPTDRPAIPTDPTPTDSTIIVPPDTVAYYPFQGTKWKLEGIVDEQSGNMQVLEPVDCEECYTLEFDTDTTAFGKAYNEKIWMNFFWLGNYCIEMKNMHPNDVKFIHALYSQNTKSYSVTDNELRFINTTDGYGLLFKRLGL